MRRQQRIRGGEQKASDLDALPAPNDNEHQQQEQQPEQEHEPEQEQEADPNQQPADADAEHEGDQKGDGGQQEGEQQQDGGDDDAEPEAKEQQPVDPAVVDQLARRLAQLEQQQAVDALRGGRDARRGGGGGRGGGGFGRGDMRHRLGGDQPRNNRPVQPRRAARNEDVNSQHSTDDDEEYDPRPNRNVSSMVDDDAAGIVAEALECADTFGGMVRWVNSPGVFKRPRNINEATELAEAIDLLHYHNDVAGAMEVLIRRLVGLQLSDYHGKFGFAANLKKNPSTHGLLSPKRFHSLLKVVRSTDRLAAESEPVERSGRGGGYGGGRGGRGGNGYGNYGNYGGYGNWHQNEDWKEEKKSSSSKRAASKKGSSAAAK